MTSSTDAYSQFISQKLANSPPTGLKNLPEISSSLFPFQQDLVRWSLRRGRCAVFADTGLGKTRIELEWARHIPGTRFILAPLSVSRQTVEEAGRVGIDARLARERVDVDGPGIYVTNYDRLHKFEGIEVDAVVLDESSIIKHHDAKTLARLLERFRETPWKLAASATPSPNDTTELGTHAEFLGICSRQEMLAEYFCHDGGDTSVWRLKKHARGAFWRWVSSWAALLRRPSDLGYPDDGYILPALTVTEHVSPADQAETFAAGLLFPEPASTLTERRKARKNTLSRRVSDCVELVRSEPGEQYVVWCELNAEQDALRRAIGDACVSISGSQDAFTKETNYLAWSNGTFRILVTKPSIFGFGINMQFCARMAFVGVTDSWESYYQATRRIWRFGQKRECSVHIFCNELEGNVLANLKKKESLAKKMSDELSQETAAMVRAEVRGLQRETNAYAPARLTMPAWLTRREPDVDC